MATFGGMKGVEVVGAGVDVGISAPGETTGGSCRAGSAGTGTRWTSEADEEDPEVDVDGTPTNSTFFLCETSGGKGVGA